VSVYLQPVLDVANDVLNRAKGALNLDKDRLHDLYNLSVANWLEQRPRFPVEMHYVESDEFRKMLPFLLPRARKALVIAYDFVEDNTDGGLVFPLDL
jgi:hypothetical protein